MLKRIQIFTTIIISLIYIALNIVVFALNPAPWLSTKGFWITWVFTFPVSYILNILVLVVFSKIKADKITRVAPIYYGADIGIVLFLSVGLSFIFKFNYILNDNISIVSIIMSILTIIYIIYFLAFYLIVSWLGKNQTIQKEKVFYIRSLVSEVDLLISTSENKEIRNLLNKVKDDIRYSDPMSKKELYNIEQKIKNEISLLKEPVINNDIERVKILTKEIRLLIKERNNQCLMMK